MSIIIHFAPASSLLQSSTVQPVPATCIVKAETRLHMGPGLENESTLSLMSTDENSIVELPENDTHIYSERERMTITVDPRTLGSCFGLPYQDHNYGAPPPPTPPCRSPQLSPILAEPIVETETVSIVTTTESEVHEASVTRCVCGFDHDDEYMISCDRCLVWQHVDCMGLDRNKIPETYLCEKCQPRKVDRQKAKNLQTKKKVAMTEKLTFPDSSDDSDVEKKHHTVDNTLSKIRNRTNRRKIDEEKDKSELGPVRRQRVNSKHVKERMEIKRSKIYSRRAKNKTENTCTADEEAQDAWKCSCDWPKKEDPFRNQCDVEVQHITDSLMHQAYQTRLAKQLLVQLCKVIETSGQKKLVATTDLSRDHMIIEYKGQFLSSTQFHQKQHVFKQRTGPFVLFHKLYSKEELCVDASECGNDARFVRRSCMPNSEIRHMIFNGRLHLYISSVKEIKRDEEITIPFDIEHKDSSQEVVCACNSENCHLISLKNGNLETSDRRRRCKKPSHSTDDDSNQSAINVLTSPTRAARSSIIKPNVGLQKVTSPVSNNTSEENDTKSQSEENDLEERLKEQKKKMTREERKLDAIMRAFDQMEKAAKRRQMALDRMAHQKTSQKTEEALSEKKEIPPAIIEEERSVTIPEEEKAIEEEKPPNNNSQPLKPKKGKRRRGSGSLSRRRVRTNSGGSDILNTDDTSESMPQSLNPPSIPVDITPPVVSTSPVCSSPPPNSLASPALPKSKRFLHHEWLQEKVELSSTSPSSMMSIHKEVSWGVQAATPTCYVRCTKDNPSAAGITAAHLRRSSIGGQGKQSSGHGSAKKRWLRQAMYDCEPSDADLISNDPVADVQSPCFSPQSQFEMGSPGISPQDDVVTPLKKRRLMRTSVESMSSPISPMAEWKGVPSSSSPENSSSEIILDTSADSNHLSNCLNLESRNIPNEEKKNAKKQVSKKLDVNSEHLTLQIPVSEMKPEMGVDTPDEETNDPSVSKFQKSLFSVISDVNCSNSETKKDTEKCVTRNLDNTVELNDKCHLSESEDKDTCSSSDLTSVHKNENCSRLSVKSDSQVLHEHSALSALVNSESEIKTNVSEKPVNIGDTLLPPSEDDLSSTQDQTFSPAKYESSPMDSVSPQQSHISSKDNEELKLDSGGDVVRTELLHSAINASQIVPEGNKATIIEVPLVCSDNAQTKTAQISLTPESSKHPVHSPPSTLCTTNSDSVIPTTSLSCEESPVTSQKVIANLNCTPHKSPSVSNKASTSTIALPLPASATCRRKVSLSEYRQRKRDNPVAMQASSDKKKSNNCILEPIKMSDSSEKEIKLAALPLFEKLANAAKSEHKDVQNENKQREKLNDRLRREFGLEDTSDSENQNSGMKHQKLTVAPEIAPILSLCTQLPPPPPPPPPHGGNVSSQYPSTYPVATTYAQANPYLVPQMAANQYITTQPSLGAQSMIPIMHPMVPSVVVQPGCTYTAAMHNGVPGTPMPNYNSAGVSSSQNYATGLQRLPHTGYNTLYKPQAYK